MRGAVEALHPASPPHLTFPLQRGEKETVIYPQTKRWQGGQQRWMTTALLEATTNRPGVLPMRSVLGVCQEEWLNFQRDLSCPGELNLEVPAVSRAHKSSERARAKG